jgi:hypothetical protein
MRPHIGMSVRSDRLARRCREPHICRIPVGGQGVRRSVVGSHLTSTGPTGRTAGMLRVPPRRLTGRAGYWLWLLVALVALVAQRSSVPASQPGPRRRTGAAILSGPASLLEPAHDHDPAALHKGLRCMLSLIEPHHHGWSFAVSRAGMRSETAVPRRRVEATAIEGHRQRAFPQLKPVKWAWLDLNQRPHPYQGSTAKRHAIQRLPRSWYPVSAAGMR